MQRELSAKLANLKKILKDMRSILVAYSGGVDSTFLLRVARDVLDGNVMAVIAKSETYNSKEIESARNFAERLNVKCAIVKTGELNNPAFYKNPVDRCYFCKAELFSRLHKIAKRYSLRWVADGSNLDDKDDFRPGERAAHQFKVRSPLREAGLGKADIRKISKHLGLPTWNKPSLACLASRFPYYTRITKKSLGRVDKAEDFLRGFGFKQVRVRHHGDLARIELLREDIPKFIKMDNRKIINRFKKLGYNYITLDLQGYRSGSMNEPLKKIGGSYELPGM
jgi:uncharacterized protein